MLVHAAQHVLVSGRPEVEGVVPVVDQRQQNSVEPGPGRGPGPGQGADMLWFDGSIPDAINAAKQRNVIFVVVIAGKSLLAC